MWFRIDDYCNNMKMSQGLSISKQLISAFGIMRKTSINGLRKFGLSCGGLYYRTSPFWWIYLVVKLFEEIEVYASDSFLLNFTPFNDLLF